jgi:tetratricopeptide (TPR) repeat protein
MSGGDVQPATAAKRAPRRHLWRGLAVVTFLALAVCALAWTRGWFAPALEVPGGNLTGDAEVVAFLQEAREAVAREPKSAATWGRLGQVLQAHQFLDPALASYKEAARLDPKDAAWPYLRATIFLDSPRPTEAIPDLRRAAEVGGLDELPRLRLGELLLEQGQVEEAEEQFRLVFDTLPDDPRAHLGMAKIAVARQAWADCLRHLDAVGDVPHARRQACALRMLAHTRLGNATEAQRERDRLVTLPLDFAWLDPLWDDVKRIMVGETARYNHVSLLMQYNHVEAAHAAIQEMVKDYPASARVWSLFGKILDRMDDIPGAERAMTRSLELDPEGGDAWAVLASIRVRQGNLPGAMECIRKVTRLKPTDAEAHYHMGLLLAETGDRAAAIEAYRQALRYRPGFRLAREALDKLTSASPKP